MNTIVFVFVSTGDRELLRSAVNIVRENDAKKAPRHVDPATPANSILPLWTWFIENPRFVAEFDSIPSRLEKPAPIAINF